MRAPSCTYRRRLKSSAWLAELARAAGGLSDLTSSVGRQNLWSSKTSFLLLLRSRRDNSRFLDTRRREPLHH